MIWDLIIALSEIDRWAVRCDPNTNEIYIEDQETLKRYGARVITLPQSTPNPDPL